MWKNIYILLVLSIPSSAVAAQTVSPRPLVTTPAAPQYFAVLVEDMDRSVSWYRSTFGLTQLDDQSDPNGIWRIVNLSSEYLFIELIWDKRRTTVKNVRGLFKVGFSVSDVSEIADRVETATGERPRIIDDERHSIRVVQLRDPDGNILQFASPLPMVKPTVKTAAPTEKGQ